MRRSVWVLILAAVVVIAGATGLTVTRRRASETDAAQTPGGPSSGAPSSGAGSPRSGRVPVVGVGHPKQTTVAATLSVTASVVSLRQATLVSKVAGYLQTVAAQPGDMVQAGQVVAVVDHAQLDAQVAQAEGALLAARAGVQTARATASAAEAQVANAVAGARRAEADIGNARAAEAKARSQLTAAQATYARATSLYRDGLIAAQAMDDAKTQVDSAQAAVDAAAAGVRVSQAAIQQAQAQVAAAQAQRTAAVSQVRTQQAQVESLAAALQTTRVTRDSAVIRAPFGGVVVSRSLDPGAYVLPGTSTPIVVVADLDQIAAVVNVGEGQMVGVRRGNRARIAVDAYPDRTFTGTVGRIAGGVDPDTRTVQAEIDIPNPGHLLRPGMFARVSLGAGAQAALTVPLSALTIVGGQQFAWIVTDSTVSRRQVTVGQATGQDAVILSGLRADDTIIVRGTELVRDGARVRAVPVGE
jgi:RND family efflux transporter MFP subunit